SDENSHSHQLCRPLEQFVLPTFVDSFHSLGREESTRDDSRTPRATAAHVFLGCCTDRSLFIKASLLCHRLICGGNMKTLFGASLIALAFITATSAQAQNCSVAQFKGVYSALAKGEFLSGIPVPPELLGPTTRIARVEVDGEGTSKLRATTSLNGIIVNEE